MKQRLKLKGNLKSYLRWPIVLSAVFIVMDIQMYLYDKKMGILGTCYLTIYMLAAVSIFFSGRKRISRDLIDFAVKYDEMQMGVMDNLTVPYAVLSEKGHLLWGNKEFIRLAVNKKAARRGIYNVFPEITENKLPDSDEVRVVHIKVEDKYYRAVMRLMLSNSEEESVNGDKDLAQLMDNNEVIVMFLYDETDIIELEQKREDENLIVGLLYIDNYDELIDSIDEVRQSLMTALIDRKINKYMQSIDAISKKLEKDKFLFVFKQHYLPELCSGRFSILEDIRGINIGNGQTATVSIGIGVGSGRFDERYEFARAAIDLANSYQIGRAHV